jgi:hypothetical protein
MNIREFAEYLGVTQNTLARWEADATQGPFHQGLLDTALRRADLTVQSRFVRLKSGEGPRRPRANDHESTRCE